MKDHTAGHRARLRTRLLTHGYGALQDYERLELLLTYVLPRQDTKALAKELIAQHQSLRNVLVAAQSDANIVSERFRVLVHMCLASTMWEDIARTRVISSAQDVMDYVLPLMSRLPHEQLRVLCVDAPGRLIYEHVVNSAWENRVSEEIPAIVRMGVLYKAQAMLVVHNHPSGDPTPSPADHVFTHKLQQACAAVNILLADHLVIAGKKFQSCFQ
jgi:DNA repair protein RadC